MFVSCARMEKSCFVLASHLWKNENHPLADDVIDSQSDNLQNLGGN